MIGKALAAYLGGVAIALGFAFTFFALGTGTGLSCGNAWSNGDDIGEFADQQVKDACTDARSERWMLALTFVSLGGAAVAASSSKVAGQENVETPPTTA